MLEENLKQHSLWKYKHETKDIIVNEIQDLKEKIEEVNWKMIDFNSRLLALE